MKDKTLVSWKLPCTMIALNVYMMTSATKGSTFSWTVPCDVMVQTAVQFCKLSKHFISAFGRMIWNAVGSCHPWRRSSMEMTATVQLSVSGSHNLVILDRRVWDVCVFLISVWFLLSLDLLHFTCTFQAAHKMQKWLSYHTSTWELSFVAHSNNCSEHHC
jgi:hypothetical protein